MARPHNAPDPFRAVAHPVRRKMLEMLRQRPRSVGELAQPFHLRFSTITAHVRALRNALWRWEEFASVKPGARRILEVVIELARDEAFPWYLRSQPTRCGDWRG